MLAKGDVITIGGNKKYTTIKILGKGASGTVWEIIGTGGPEGPGGAKHKYALKSISKNNLTPKKISEIKNEIRNHRVLDHENIVKFFDYFQDIHAIYIILELCKYDLNKMIKKHYEEVQKLYQTHIDSGNENEYQVLSIIPYDILKEYAKGILEGIIYMHDKNIAHLDIKPQNILICNDIPKISDFGFSRDISQPITAGAGTPNYVAPEIIQHKSYTTEPDIWSYGVTIYTCVIGKAPFENATFDINQMYQDIINIKYSFPSETSFIQPTKEIKHIIRLCLRSQEERTDGGVLLQYLRDNF